MANKKPTIEVMEEASIALHALLEEIAKALRLKEICDWLESRLEEIIGK